MSEFVDEPKNLKVIFKLGGSREMVDLARATALLADVPQYDEGSVVAVRLSNKSFSAEAATLIGDRVKSLPSVDIADISDIIAGRPEEEALKTLAIISDSLARFNATEVNLSDNALGAKGIHACKPLLIGSRLEKLYLCNNGLSAESCQLVSDVIFENGVPPIKVLHFYNNMSGDGGGIAVSKIIARLSTTLQDFRYSSTRCMNAGCLAIAEVLITVPSLLALDLSDACFGQSAAEKLAEALSLQKGLVRLNLRDTGLTEAGVTSVIQSLEGAQCPLQFLDLSGNEITEELMEELAPAITSFTELEELYLDDNELTSAGAVLLAKAIKPLSKLRVLSLNSCELTAKGAYYIASIVAQIPSFSTLSIDGNQIVEDGRERIVSKLLSAGKILKDVDDNDEDGDDDLQEALDELEAGAAEEDSENEDELVASMQKARLED